MNINSFIKEVHENAVAHGWWETDRPLGETIALIHSELSEALEEYRAGRPMVWHGCEANGPIHPCETCPDCADKDMAEDWGENKCLYYENKPEGIAVELMDAAIRIFDLLGKIKFDEMIDKIDSERMIELTPMTKIDEENTFPVFIASMHSRVGDVFEFATVNVKLTDIEWHWILFDIAATLMRYVNDQGFDPAKILREKHEYNKTRPYKHGKVC